MEDFLNGNKPLLPEKLCELIQLLNISSEKKGKILNTNLVIEVSLNKRPDFALAILDLLQEKVPQDTFKENFSLTLFYIASVLPELEGNIEKIAKFISIDISMAKEIVKKLGEAGILIKSEFGEIKAKYSWMYLERIIKGDLDY